MQDEHKHSEAYHFTVDNKPFEQHEEVITGAHIKELVHAPTNYGVWLIVHGPKDDEEIGDTQKVHLKHKVIDKFITGPKHTTEGVHDLPA